MPDGDMLDFRSPPIKRPQRPIEIADNALFLLTEKSRFKVIYGGRGSAKSWSMARALLVKAMQGKELILCAREYQNSIADSVHALLKGQIALLGLESWFDIEDKEIVCKLTGSKFIFKGLHRNVQEIKSTEGVTICWVEEAQSVSEESWRVLIPTIRGKAGSEIWVSFNPNLEEDPTSQRFLVKQDDRVLKARINWSDNPWFPPDLDLDRKADLANDPDTYGHIWDGDFLTLSEAAIFKGRYEVREMEVPQSAYRPFFGLDFGFANDPNFGVKLHVLDAPGGGEALYIEEEIFGYQVEIDDLPQFLEGGKSKKDGRRWAGLTDVRRWPIKADSARPETISYLRRQGFHIVPTIKWPNSVEDGIQHLKGFTKIYIHPRCIHMIQEAKLYRFKTDKKTGEILPIPEDKHNHGWDASRYAIDTHIKGRGRTGVWAKLGRQAR